MTTTPAFPQLDDLDRAILRELERNARIPNRELAARVQAAESTCHKRVRALVAAGVITGFHAEINPDALGLQIQAIIVIRLHAHARGNLRPFQQFLERLPATRRVYFVSGDRDFLVHVAVRDVSGLRDLVSDTISVRPEVAATNTSLIFDYARRRWHAE